VPASDGIEAGQRKETCLPATKLESPLGVPNGDSFVEVVEVGTRDGLQIEATIVPTDQKIALLEKVIASGIRHIEVTAFVSPKAVPQLADAEEVIAGLGRRADVNLMALVPNLRAAERACATALNGGVLLCSASESHNRKNLNRSIAESLASFPAIANELRDACIDVLGGMAVAFGCPFEGDVPHDSVLRIAATYAELGVRHLTLGDTTGMATPRNIRSLVQKLRQEFPQIELTLHLHNTRGIGLANVLVGLDLGIRRFDAATGGTGGCPFAPGATGNISTEDLVYLLEESGYRTGVALDRSIDVAKTMERLLDKPLPGQVMHAGPRLNLHPLDSVRSAVGG
jgi:hydroxymethylglutaryl-CoA lyase